MLWVATKPAWPPTDGGRALMAATIDALAAAGVSVTFVAPAGRVAAAGRPGGAGAPGGIAPGDIARVGAAAAGIAPAGVRVRLTNARPHAWLRAAWRSRRSGRPVGIERHAADRTAHVVADLVRRERFDVVCVEQLQAWSNAAPAIRAGVASVLRAQNVESDLWRTAASASRGGALLRAEARRLERFEADALAAADTTIALCARDAVRLSAASPSARIVVVPPPASPHWQAAPPPATVLATRGSDADEPQEAKKAKEAKEAAEDGDEAAKHRLAGRGAVLGENVRHATDAHIDVHINGPIAGRIVRQGHEGGVTPASLAGEPAFTWIGSPGWLPNDDGVRWLVREIWPAIAGRVAGAHLHVFGGASGRGRFARNSGITWHAAPIDSGVVFAAGTVLLLPLRTAVGVRLRLLEAWARGVPVIATPAAVDGLEAIDAENVLLAEDPRGFADAAERLAAQPDLRARLVQHGQATVARHHDPATIAHAMIAAFREAIAYRHHMQSAG